jgi:hypothetical protein
VRRWLRLPAVGATDAELVGSVDAVTHTQRLIAVVSTATCRGFRADLDRRWALQHLAGIQAEDTRTAPTLRHHGGRKPSNYSSRSAGQRRHQPRRSPSRLARVIQKMLGRPPMAQRHRMQADPKPPRPRSLVILQPVTGSLMMPAKLGSHTSSLYSRCTGRSPNPRHSIRTSACLRSARTGA